MTRTAASDDAIAIVSADTHVGPLVREQLRDYCPAAHLEAFDEFASELAHFRGSEAVPADFVSSTMLVGAGEQNLASAGHHDMTARLQDMDRDGIAAEVVFHGSVNGEPIPFRRNTGFFSRSEGEDPRLAAVGTRIYNRWLADACSIQPERHAGLAQLPIWDIAASVEELHWARGAGLRGANLPAMRLDLPEYNDPSWDPLWAAATELDMPLSTHIGAGSPARFAGPEALPLKMFEDGMVFGFRAVHWMILGGVFERFPALKLVITELAGDWWGRYVDSLDDLYRFSRRLPDFAAKVPHLPSVYCAKNIWYCASFMAPFEAEAAVRDGYLDRVLWGTDYPHAEGTWQYDYEVDGQTATRLALRNTFSEIDAHTTRQILGASAMEVYGLDPIALAAVAERIDAPRPSELAVPLDGRPDGVSGLAFRRRGAWT